jgi:nicotinate-nucleotide adenylyltransferase
LDQDPLWAMRVGILGGSFDPIHYGHLWLAEAAREQLALDQIWLIPARVSPLKTQAPPSDGAVRAEMLRLAVGGCPEYVVQTCELQREGPSYTVDTMRELQDQHPDHRFYLLLGADALTDLGRWREPQQLAGDCQICVVERAGEAKWDHRRLEGILPLDAIERIREHTIRMPAIEIASRTLRQRIADGKSIRFQTPRAVEELIRAQGLYRHRSD